MAHNKQVHSQKLLTCLHQNLDIGSFVTQLPKDWHRLQWAKCCNHKDGQLSLTWQEGFEEAQHTSKSQEPDFQSLWSKSTSRLASSLPIILCSSPSPMNGSKWLRMRRKSTTCCMSLGEDTGWFTLSRLLHCTLYSRYSFNNIQVSLNSVLTFNFFETISRRQEWSQNHGSQYRNRICHA